ncbi:MAG: TIR domain-containing protein [Actinomycetota bacterium]
MAHVFVSYASADREFALRLADELSEAGLQVWIDRERLGPGPFAKQIGQAIAAASEFVLVVSPAAEASTWVEAELGSAHKVGLTGDRLLPVILEPVPIWVGVDSLQSYVARDGHVPEALVRTLVARRFSNDWPVEPMPQQGAHPKSVEAAGVAAQAAGQAEVFVLTTSGRVVHSWRGHDGWSGWAERDRLPRAKALDAASHSQGQLEVVVVDHGGHVHHSWARDREWRPFAELPRGGDAPGSVVDVAMASRRPGHLEVFVLTTSGRITHTWWQGDVWSDWIDLGVGSHRGSAIAASRAGTGGLDLVVLEAYGSIRWTRSERQEWPPLVEVPMDGEHPESGRDLAVTSAGGSQTTIAVLTASGRVTSVEWDGRRWSAWQRRLSSRAERLAAATDAAGSGTVVLAGRNGTLHAGSLGS